jgi:chemotaxis protein methyltransferase CheR
MSHEIEDTLSDACFAEFLRLIHSMTGITISESRKSMVISRLRKRLIANSLTRFDEYLTVVRKNADEVPHFINSITTNETYFYRTPRVWTYLTDEFVPQWINTNPGRPLRLWSAAASTGEEAYTAGVLLEAIRERNKTFDYRIVGTDISTRVIGVAQKGLYSGRAIERFQAAHPDMFRRHMHGTEEEGFSVSSVIQERLKFQTQNLFKPSLQTKGFDIVLLRNVLIYFTKPDQEQVLKNIHQAMDPNGVLVIGESESLSSLATGFKSVAPFVYCRSSEK